MISWLPCPLSKLGPGGCTQWGPMMSAPSASAGSPPPPPGHGGRRITEQDTKGDAVEACVVVVRVHEKMLLAATVRTGHLRERIQMVHRRDLIQNMYKTYTKQYI